NPCIQCNGRVRIEPMVELADALGAERLVTGHYARLVELESPDGPLVSGGADPAKDQAYALARVPTRVLAKMDFPLGAMTKAEVRQAARDRGLAVADAPDSQDLCFIAGIGRERFLAEHGQLGPREGDIVDPGGNRLGAHNGFFNHTIGQRRGLGIGGGTPLFVIGTDAETNTVTVGGRADLRTRRVVLEDLDLRRPAERVRSARLRHHADSSEVERVDIEGGLATIHFASDVERVAPGQVACLLDGETVVGCGTVSARES
ncbi:MAG: tRNA methyl transferase PRC-barrel domain-containing protein, partial [Actinomycetes bacterium]